MAKKLQESGVFGAYGDEYVKNAQANRDEWVACGEDVVVEMMGKVKSMKERSRATSLKRTGSQNSMGSAGALSTSTGSLGSSGWGDLSSKRT